MLPAQMVEILVATAIDLFLFKESAFSKKCVWHFPLNEKSNSPRKRIRGNIESKLDNS